ncbi:GAF domain-containing protein [Dongshaea marina]|uniref:GAF domain-containing protein n=1 Tax=Dongshaea marina TaxID=2047966 RepID=UPI000D3E789F|nr:GAF domain-containing protein [Dongshaea marina]
MAYKPLDVPLSTLDEWQEMLNVLAELLQVPAALIMRLTEEDIEVFVSSESEGNPYHPGDHEHFSESGLYCEYVIKTGDALYVGSALDSERWRDNPDIKLNMIAYLGLPLLLPDRTPFGTICVLDSKVNHFSEVCERLMHSMKKVIQGHLELIAANQELGDQNRTLSDYIEEVKVLRGIIPICCCCMRIIAMAITE